MACDGNEIDTMFVDRRRDGGQTGQTLVKVLEGFVVFVPFGGLRFYRTCVNSVTGHLL